MEKKNLYDCFVSANQKQNQIETIDVDNKHLLVFKILSEYIPNFSTEFPIMAEPPEDERSELFQKLYIIWALSTVGIDAVKLKFTKNAYNNKYLVYNIGSLEFSISTPFLVCIDYKQSIVDLDESPVKDQNLLRAIGLESNDILEEILKLYVPKNLPTAKSIPANIKAPGQSNVFSGDFVFYERLIYIFIKSTDFENILYLYNDSNSYVKVRLDKSIKLVVQNFVSPSGVGIVKDIRKRFIGL